MSFLQLVLSLDKTKEEIILFWRICQFDRYRNIGYLVTDHSVKYYTIPSNNSSITEKHVVEDDILFTNTLAGKGLND